MALSPELKMTKAKARLVMEQPFYATLVCNLELIRDDTCGTMATNGQCIYWDAAFVDKLTVDEVLFVICHEVMHCVFQHTYNIGDRDPYNWNVATDYVINDLLVKDKIGIMPAMGLMNSALVVAGKGTSDGVYNLLPPPPPDSGQQYGSKGHPMDKLRPATGTPAQQAAAKATMQVHVAQAANSARIQGNLSANLARIVDNALKSQVPWQDVLRRFVSMRAKVEVSFSRPKRRFMADDLYLPSLSGESMGELVVAVDCSGSIEEKELNEFAAEIRAIVDDVHPECLHVVYFDSDVCHYESYREGDTLDIKPHGGGGTAFSPIMEYIAKNAINAVALVVLTDLCCSDFGPAPDYPVMWVTTDNTAAPWGEVIRMRQGA